MSTTLSLHLSPELDAKLRGEKSTGESVAAEPLTSALRKYHLKPIPLFPEVPESMPAAQACVWHVSCPSHQAQEIAEKLAHLPGVEGAYVKPGEEPA
jgi:hypothetical protein